MYVTWVFNIACSLELLRKTNIDWPQIYIHLQKCMAIKKKSTSKFIYHPHAHTHPHTHAHTHPHPHTYCNSSSFSCTEETTERSSLAFSSLYTDAASYARMGTRRANMSLPTFLESDGWNVMGLTRSAPEAETLTVDTLLLRRGRGYYLVGIYSRDIDYGSSYCYNYTALPYIF